MKVLLNILLLNSILLMCTSYNNISKYDVVSSSRFIILFNKNTVAIDSSNSLLLDDFIELIKEQKIYDDYKYKIILYTVYCNNEELQIDKFIGFKRAKEVLDYLVEKHKFDKERILVMDMEYDVKRNSPNCLNSGIGIKLEKR